VNIARSSSRQFERKPIEFIRDRSSTAYLRSNLPRTQASFCPDTQTPSTEIPGLELALGDRFDGIEILGVLGKGAFATVCSGENEGLTFPSPLCVTCRTSLPFQTDQLPRAVGALYGAGDKRSFGRGHWMNGESRGKRRVNSTNTFAVPKANGLGFEVSAPSASYSRDAITLLLASSPPHRARHTPDRSTASDNPEALLPSQRGSFRSNRLLMTNHGTFS
jgi:hypothetical protein